LEKDNILKVSKKYKYLNYVPAPVNLDYNFYDLVDDDEFMKLDGRIPLLIVTQYGIFPSDGIYSDKNHRGYRQLIGLENQTVGFIGRGYLSNREREGIFELYLDTDTVNKIRSKEIFIDLHLWNNNGKLLKMYLKKTGNKEIEI
jgi:hypothetical protein